MLQLSTEYENVFYVFITLMFLREHNFTPPCKQSYLWKYNPSNNSSAARPYGRVFGWCTRNIYSKILRLPAEVRKGKESARGSGLARVSVVRQAKSIYDYRREFEYADICGMSVLLCESDKMQIKHKARWRLMKIYPLRHPSYSLPTPRCEAKEQLNPPQWGCAETIAPATGGWDVIGELYEYS
jgi:hypothetical protein